jgi:GDPmannose 4,6-dehydratase
VVAIEDPRGSCELSEQRRALITGITGQDGSYLADLLLEKNYEVHGMVRRSSTETFQRIEHIRDRITLHTGDLLDQRSLGDMLRASEPHEIYNLAAMSFVAASWNQPVLTAEFSGMGVTRMLEAMREVTPEARFYQASSSEMFGKVREVPQNEATPFYPRSPYGVAKVYGHFITVNYRDSYDLFTCSGILFNHECVFSNTPLIVRNDGLVDVITPMDVFRPRQKGRSIQTSIPEGLEIWDGDDWVEVRAITATRRRTDDPEHHPLSIEARAGVVGVTAHHNMLDSDDDVARAAELEEGDQLKLAESLPEPLPWTVLTIELAELLGALAGDGYVSRDGRHIRFTNNDEQMRSGVATLWSQVFTGSSHLSFGPSGWDREREVGRLDLRAPPGVGTWLRSQLYTKDSFKKVPQLVLNATRDVQEAFLNGYYATDGLKKGGGDSVKTNSPVLAQGLVLLYSLQGRECSVYAEQRGEAVYYQLNVRSPVLSGKGQHLVRNPAEIRRIEPLQAPPSDWNYDIETESGKLCAGVGRLVIKNSPRRGREFVTRKVSHAAASIKLGLQDKLRLGNLEARRDWGYAKDYVEAMWMMLQEDEPDDYVIATGEAHSVRELVDVAFAHVGLDPDEYVGLDPTLLRPAEVDHLIGDASKAREKLGWEPRTSFEELIRMMVDADLELLERSAPRQAGAS